MARSLLPRAVHRQRIPLRTPPCDCRVHVYVGVGTDILEPVSVPGYFVAS
jgi:hypothetical protein